MEHNESLSPVGSEHIRSGCPHLENRPIVIELIQLKIADYRSQFGARLSVKTKQEQNEKRKEKRNREMAVIRSASHQNKSDAVLHIICMPP